MNYDFTILAASIVSLLAFGVMGILMFYEQSRRKVLCAMSVALGSILFLAFASSTSYFRRPDVHHASIAVDGGIAKRFCYALIVDSTVYTFSTHGDTLILKDARKDGYKEK